MPSTIFTIGQATNWITKLTAHWLTIRKDRGKEIDAIGDELLVSPDLLLDYYIPPYIQPYNPADELDEMENNFRAPAFDAIEAFFNSKRHNDIRHLFLLADSGMGKTSLLAMLKLQHEGSFWPKSFNCMVLKLGENTLERIAEIRSRHRTILLLDALDEDRAAIGRIEDRIEDLLRHTSNFFRVIITCRTQFFPKTREETFLRQDRVVIAGYKVPVKFISLFDNNQVDEYLSKVCKTLESKNRAKGILNKIKDLRFRPMLLSYLEDLLDETDQHLENPYFLYHSLVEHWLNREVRKNTNIKKKDLLEWCEVLALELTRANERELDVDKINELLFFEELDSISLGGRSLLNINSYGYYRFAHKSFQEFLVVRSIKTNKKFNLPFPSEMITMFMRNTNLEEVDFSDCFFEDDNLTGANFRGAFFQNASIIGCSLNKAILSDADFSLSNLSSSEFNNASLEKANLSNADLTKASLKQANLSMASFSNTQLHKTRLTHSKISRTIFRDCEGIQTSFRSCTIVDTLFERAQLTEADFNNTIFKNSKIDTSILKTGSFESSNWNDSRIDFSNLAFSKAQNSSARNTNITETIINESNFERSTFKNVLFKTVSANNADFKNCKFIYCTFEDCSFNNVNFENCLFINTKLQSSSFNLANFVGSTFEDSSIKECELNEVKLSNTSKLDPTILGNTKILWWIKNNQQRYVESKYLIRIGKSIEIDENTDPISLRKKEAENSKNTPHSINARPVKPTPLDG